MYHPGKVIAVLSATDRNIISADTAVQATLRMWDENVLTMSVAPKIAPKIREGDLVLVDYRPDPAHQPPVPSHTIVKIIDGKKAESVWSTYRDMHDRQKRTVTPPAQNYIG